MSLIEITEVRKSFGTTEVLKNIVAERVLESGRAAGLAILGATGSIGASTIDLIKRERSRYRVEALSANTNATALAALARELNARFAAIADPSAYDELKSALAGSGIAAGAGESALIEAAARPAETACRGR